MRTLTEEGGGIGVGITKAMCLLQDVVESECLFTKVKFLILRRQPHSSCFRINTLAFFHFT